MPNGFKKSKKLAKKTRKGKAKKMGKGTKK